MQGSVSGAVGACHAAIEALPGVRARRQRSMIGDFLVETAGGIGHLADARWALFTGVFRFVIAAAIGGVTLRFSSLLRFGGQVPVPPVT